MAEQASAAPAEATPPRIDPAVRLHLDELVGSIERSVPLLYSMEDRLKEGGEAERIAADVGDIAAELDERKGPLVLALRGAEQPSRGAFSFSPAFGKAVEQLDKIARVDGLDDGWAVFSSDLSEVRWYTDLPEAQMHAGAEEPIVRVPNYPGGEWAACGFLIGGIAYAIEHARHMYGTLRDSDRIDEETLAGYEAIEQTMLAHLFWNAGADEAWKGAAPDAVIHLTKKERNVLSDLVTDAMEGAGESLSSFYESYKPKTAREAAGLIAQLTPLRDALGWKRKGKRRTVPAGLVADALAIFLDETREHLASSATAANRRREEGAVGGESAAAEALAKDAAILRALLSINVKLSEATGETARPPAPEGGLTDQELDQLEHEAVEEVAAVALRHANRLPARSDKRHLLKRIADLRLGLADAAGRGVQS